MQFESADLAGEDVEQVSIFCCRRCGRTLSTPQSLLAGYGKTCAAKVFYESLREETGT